MTLSLLWERIYPILLSICTCIIWNKAGRPFPDSPDGIFGTAATVASIFASFLGVSQSIILTIKNSTTFKALSRHGYDKEVFFYLRSGISSSLIFIVLSLLGFFIRKGGSLLSFNTQEVFHMLWVGSATYAFLTFFRMTYLMFKILKTSM